MQLLESRAGCLSYADSLLAHHPIIAKVSTPAGIVLLRNNTPLEEKVRIVYETFVNVPMLLKRTTPKRSKLDDETTRPLRINRAKKPDVLNGTPFR